MNYMEEKVCNAVCMCCTCCRYVLCISHYITVIHVIQKEIPLLVLNSFFGKNFYWKRKQEWPWNSRICKQKFPWGYVCLTFFHGFLLYHNRVLILVWMKVSVYLYFFVNVDYRGLAQITIILWVQLQRNNQ